MPVQLMPLLSHPNEEIVYEVLALLKVLLECGNKTVQAGLEKFIKEKEHALFPTLQRMLKQSAVAYRERYITCHTDIANHSKVFFIYVLYNIFSHFLTARMKDRITTDRKLVSILLFKFTALCKLYTLIIRVCHGVYQQIRNSKKQNWYYNIVTTVIPYIVV